MEGKVGGNSMGVLGGGGDEGRAEGERREEEGKESANDERRRTSGKETLKLTSDGIRRNLANPSSFDRLVAGSAPDRALLRRSLDSRRGGGRVLGDQSCFGSERSFLQRRKRIRREQREMGRGGRGGWVSGCSCCRSKSKSDGGRKEGRTKESLLT